jgi:glutamate synthase (NADPH/NADH) large chain
MEKALTMLCERAEEAVHAAATTSSSCPTAWSVRTASRSRAAGDGAVHHHLIRKGLRTSVGLVVETGEAREVHHFACLAGYGAEAINPYLAFDTLATCTPALKLRTPEVDREVVERYIKAIGKGLLKVMSKMGISTYQSYCGAQIFDAVGLSRPSSTSISPAPPPWLKASA